MADVRKKVKVPRPLERTGGIDWYRYIVEDGETVRLALEIADEIQEEDRQNGSKSHSWTFGPYVGHATESLRWGRFGGKLLWETSGARAPSTWTRMPSSGGKATRVDLHQTLRLSTPQPLLPHRLLPPEAMTHPYRLPCGTPVRLETGADGLWCGRVARRTAPEHWRLYDKGRERKSHAAGELWRLELELKGTQAQRITCQHLQELKNPEWCGNYCASRWLSRGCSWPFSKDVEALAPLRGDGPPPQTADALLKWLETSVRPVVERLRPAVGHRALRVALGLTGNALTRGSDSGREGDIPRPRHRGLPVAGDLPFPSQCPVGDDTTGADGRRS